jgi:hypothetical protein
MVHVTVDEATAVWPATPCRQGWALLPAVGVRPRSVIERGGHAVARFSFDLVRHLRAGQAAGFTRTDVCNRFFLSGGRVDGPMTASLLGEGEPLLTEARAAAVSLLSRQVVRFCHDGLAMRCRPGGADAPYPLGNTVPVGIALRALRTYGLDAEDAHDAAATASEWLATRREDGRWAFHAGDLPTALDSALVLLGVNDRAAVSALEAFAHPDGGYRAQLCGPGPRAMPVGARNRHWCEADVPTTGLVQGLRARHGLPVKTGGDWLLSRWQHRDGLFFANPYLADWAYALGLPPGESGPRRALCEEVLAGMNPDGSFGAYEVALSTSLAILCLAATGCDRRTLRASQLRLRDLLDDDGAARCSTPFYSALVLTGRLPATAILLEMRRRPDWQLVRVGSRWLRVSLYEDVSGVMGTALAALALGAEGERRPPSPGPAGPCQPRYRAGSCLEYVERFALPPYMRVQESTAREGTSSGRRSRSSA